MRFISTDDRTISLSDIETALKQLDAAYSITNDEVPDLGDLMYEGNHHAVIEINRPGEDIFEDDLDSFRSMVQGKTANEERVRQVLDSARAMVVVEAFWEGENSEPVLQRIDPLWTWLFDNFEGLSQADNEGFYDASGLLLERTFTI